LAQFSNVLGLFGSGEAALGSGLQRDGSRSRLDYGFNGGGQPVAQLSRRGSLGLQRSLRDGECTSYAHGPGTAGHHILDGLDRGLPCCQSSNPQLEREQPLINHVNHGVGH
jgi:hypothetical protein